VAAVCRELVSGELEFPANNREFPEFGVSMPIPGPFDPYFRAVTREFPAYPNREFFEAEQGIKSLEQGIWTAEQGTEKGTLRASNLTLLTRLEQRARVPKN